MKIKNEFCFVKKLLCIIILFPISLVSAKPTTGVAYNNSPCTIVITASTLYNVSCYGGANGEAIVYPSGGITPYTYFWSPLGRTARIGTGLSAGVYTVSVTDSSGCSASATATITQPTAIYALADTLDATDGNCNGEAWVAVSGGTSPYRYSWSGGLTTDTISNLCAGRYLCLVKDVNGCTTALTVNINNYTGIAELEAKSEEIQVYPNPNNGIFTVVCHSERSEESPPIIEIYNMLGEKVFTETLRSAQGDNLIDLLSQPNGIYLYRVLKETGELMGEGKVIVDK